MAQRGHVGSNRPADGRLERIRLVVTRANGHPALAAYLPDNRDRECRGYGIMVLTITGDQVATITGFPDPDLFPLFDLPTTASLTSLPLRAGGWRDGQFHLVPGTKILVEDVGYRGGCSDLGPAPAGGRRTKGRP